MTLENWLKAAVADVRQRGLPELEPLLEALGRASASLRAADFNDDAAGGATARLKPSRSSR